MKEFIWYEKYRPCSLTQMALSDKNMRLFKHYISRKNIPHLLFHGLKGSGKTTVAQILINSIPCQVLSLNASSKEERGIETMRRKVGDFAGSKAISGKIKIVFLDEADGITLDAQRSLKNTIEKFNKTTRFILTSNHFDGILPEIQSRCTEFAFDRFPIEKVIEHIEDILEKEDVDYDSDDLKKIVERFYPDIRTVINQVQAASISGELNLKNISSRIIEPQKIGDLILKGGIRKIRETLFGVGNFMFLYKYLFDDFIAKNFKVPADAALAVADYLYRDRTVADREINFTACCIELMTILKVEVKF